MEGQNWQEASIFVASHDSSKNLPPGISCVFCAVKNFFLLIPGVLRHVQPLLMKGEEHKVSAKRPYSIVTCRSPAAAREARKLLRAVIDKFGGGPVGVDNLAAAIGEERDTIEDVLEPYLIQQGYLQRTLRGRIATAQAYRHFGLAEPRGDGPRDLWDGGTAER